MEWKQVRCKINFPTFKPNYFIQPITGLEIDLLLGDVKITLDSAMQLNWTYMRYTVFLVLDLVIPGNSTTFSSDDFVVKADYLELEMTALEYAFWPNAYAFELLLIFFGRGYPCFGLCSGGLKSTYATSNQKNRAMEELADLFPCIRGNCKRGIMLPRIRAATRLSYLLI